MADWVECFDEAMQNAIMYGTGFIKVTTNGPEGITLSVVKPEDYRYVMEEPESKSQALTKKEAEDAWEESKGANNRLKAYNNLLDDKLWKKNKLRQYKENT